MIEPNYQKIVHIVPHMHWDREWYFSTEESQILLVNNMDEIMDLLENDSEYPAYVLDGQTAILEDYFAAKPENFERVKKLVKAGRLKIGPWYTQTDEMIVGAESMTRNLLYGLKDSKRMGRAMMIGYVPDSFGQSAQTPMLLNQFGINRSLFWRGFSEERKGTNSSEFNWQSADGSVVLAENFPLGYASGKYLEDDPEELKQRMDKVFKAFDARSNGRNELLPNGHDQMPIQQNIHEVIKTLHELYPDRDFKLDSYEGLFKSLKQENVPTVTGEMLDGKNGRVHRSIYSVRMDLKAYNTRIENKITNILEPLASLAKHFGLPYQHGLIELIWKELMKNHAHDSIGGCVSDKVNREIWGRYLVAEERVDKLIEFYMRRLSEASLSPEGRDKLTLFNLIPGKRESLTTAMVITKANGFILEDEAGHEVPFVVIHKDTIDAGIVDRQIVAHGNYEPFNQFKIELDWQFESIGYQTLTVVPVERPLSESGKKRSHIETDAYKISVLNNGTLTIIDKVTGKQYENVLNVEEQGNDGDEYDFSPLPGDESVYSAELVNDAKITINEFLTSYRIRIDFMLAFPVNLIARSQKPTNMVKNRFSFSLVIPKHGRTIEITARVDNQAKDHRLRVLFPTNIAADESISDNQFGVIRRPVRDQMRGVWKENHWDERPDEIFPFLSYVSVSDQQTVSVFTNSTREYQILGKQIGLTLLSGVQWLGKSDLVRRPGRPSGIHAQTPDGQVVGVIKLDFALRIDPQPFESTRVAEFAKEYLTPIVSYNKISFEAMHLNPPEVQLSPTGKLALPIVPKAVQSVLKESEDGRTLLIRYYNPTEKDLSLPKEVKQYRLDEQEVEATSKLKPNQVITLEVEDLV